MKRTLLTILIIGLFASITIAQKVKSDQDPDADFTKYTTYQFLGWQDDSDQIMNDLDKSRMRDAFKEEMDKRGLKQVESDADMAISLFIVVDQKTSTSAYTNYHGGTGYRYRGGYGWGNGYSSTSYSQNDYLEGTLVMDVFDTRTKKLIWEGIANGTITEKPEKRAKKIPKVVAKLMKKFPIDQSAE